MFFVRDAKAATLYWHKEGADNQWTTLSGNWWTDIEHSSGASELPGSGDDVITLGTTYPEVDLDSWTEPSSIEASSTGIVFTNEGMTCLTINITGSTTFNGTSCNQDTTVTGTTTFNGSSYNAGTITGTTTFNDTSFNWGTITGTTTFNGASFNSGTITGTAKFTYATGGVITIPDEGRWGSGTADTIVGNDDAPITEWVFEGASANYGTITGTTTFNGNYSEDASGGGITGTRIRQYTTSTTTTRNFQTDGPWTVQADGAGVIVDASGATFDTDAESPTYTTVQALNGACFEGGPGTQCSTVPDAPTSLSASTSTPSEANLTWTAPADGGSTILYYTVISDPEDYVATTTSTSTTATGLTNGTEYTFTVSATNAIGISATSSASNAVTPQVNSYAITSSAGSNGSISPLGTTTVTEGDSQTFTITADSGYHILDVLVDSASQGAIATYTFSSVATDHTISATFEVDAPVVSTVSNSSGSSARLPIYNTPVTTTPVPGCPTGYTCTPKTVPNCPVGYTCVAKTLPTNQLPTTGYSFTRDLQLGDTGSDVKALQQYLNTHGYTVATTGPGSPGNETDFFGSLTRASVIRFQKANNIYPSLGYFGPLTRGVILSL